jgi:hypothetical protein
MVCVLDKGILLNVDPVGNIIFMFPDDRCIVASVSNLQSSLLYFFSVLIDYLNTIWETKLV